MAAPWKAGLEGVVAGKTSLSMVDGQQGRLTYRGLEIGDLARESCFEEVCHLLWQGALPNRAGLMDTRERLAKERTLPNEVVNVLKVLAGRSPPMDALRSSVSMLAPFDPDVERNDPASNMRKAHRITAKTATIIAAYHRLREGHDPIPPKHDLSHAANFLYMLYGREPDAEMARDFDVCLVLHADHGFNASTFAARAIASSLSDMHSAVTGAVGSLKGPLHGGANEAVMHMLEDIGSAARAEQYIIEKLGSKEKIPGFGHRIYKVLDPRAPTLKEMSERLGKRGGNLTWYEMSTKIQAKVKAMKALDANVDFYSASVYHSMGIPTDLFTPIFALSRVAGWTAHVMEQLNDNRIYRPDAEYIGTDRVEYTPIDKRS
ncbi:MAG TPA: citrate/2-methylcitrate synthase [Candidatus Thermoplasmatota archaeon]|nr:citrate/2-methylcitrate synthase [Candidatus Thermoplasmatota archaeon]